MAEERQMKVAATPKKRKRKSELEQLLEYGQSQANASTSETDDNPWTPRENLEVLRIHRDYESSGNPKQFAARLHDKMTRIRRTAFQPELRARTGREFMSQVRQLEKDGVTIEDLEAELELFSEEETPAKKKQKQRRLQNEGGEMQ